MILLLTQFELLLIYQTKRNYKRQAIEEKRQAVKRPKESIGWQDKKKIVLKKKFKNFTYGKQSKRPLRFYGGAIFLSEIV